MPNFYFVQSTSALLEALPSVSGEDFHVVMIGESPKLLFDGDNDADDWMVIVMLMIGENLNSYRMVIGDDLVSNLTPLGW